MDLDVDKTKDKILEKLSQLNTDTLDRLKNEKLLELKDLLKTYHKHKDEHLVKKHAKEQELVSQGLPDSKIDRLLRRDKELFNLKKLIDGYSYLIKEIKLEIEILKDYFWRNKY